MHSQGTITRLRRVITTTVAASALAASALAAGTLAAPAVAAQHHAAANATTYTFTTLDDQADPTFNQLLGINNGGQIAGYFGSGAAGHPNKGYLLRPPYAQVDYTNENFPGSQQTQVTGLNNKGVTVGFWVDASGDNFPFYRSNGIYHTVLFPTTYGTTVTSQMLGVNDNRVAVGFYNDTKGNSHGFTYDIATDTFKTVSVTGLTSLTATAINNNGDVAGFGTTAKGITEAFLIRAGQTPTVLQVPGGTNTQAFGVNKLDEVVGSYLDGAGVLHGFTWTSANGFQSIDDPNGIGSTVVNGVNDNGTLVGFYTDGAGNTDGMLAKP